MLLNQLNHSRKEYFDTQNTREWYTGSNPLIILLGYGRDASWYRYSGLWLGGIIEVSDTKPSGVKRETAFFVSSSPNRNGCYGRHEPAGGVVRRRFRLRDSGPDGIDRLARSGEKAGGITVYG